jgi:DNA-binding PadR family transcriptional regulator
MARKQLQTLTEPMYYILLSVLEPLHGYAIMQRIEQMTQGRVAVGPGTLYSLISRFEKEGIVHRVPSEEGKKVYVISKFGRDILNEEWERLKSMLSDGEALIGEEQE